ncbi:MAG TPA: hypothetical protein VJ839_08485 [Candidatus Limnocylindria bacterium]|nr:hypothetical protein [Candidatus Limnocylindria bacterium]
MSWRLLGCGLLGAVVFVALGIWALTLAMGRIGCPATLNWDDQIYVAVGETTSTPSLGEGEPVQLGVTFVGVLTREVYGPEGSSPTAEPRDRPEQLALACGDETFQTYALP